MKKLHLMSFGGLLAAGIAAFASAGGVNPAWSIARQWDEELLQAIRLATPRPPVHARNLYHTSAAMYDAWAAYDPTARGVFVFEKQSAADVALARREAMSFAAYRILKARFITGNGPNIATIQANLDALFLGLGYDKTFTSTAGNTPAALGNRIAAAVLAQGLTDGANEQGNYAPNNGYVAKNAPMAFKLPGTVMAFPNRWQPLAFDFQVLQNGEVVGASIQSVIAPHWGGVRAFGLAVADRNPVTGVAFDQGGPPVFGQAAHQSDAVDMVAKNAAMDPASPTMVDLGLGVWHNSPLGDYTQVGYPVNPVTGEPYPPNVVKLADYSRVLAEWWADGPDSETPPGHWHVVANKMSDSPALVCRIGGVGKIVDRLEWDTKMYLTLSGATHDAAVAAWGAKGQYDSARPISFLRHMAALGQSTSRKLPHFHAAGIPLVPGLIELVTASDVLPGGRFEDFPETIYSPIFGEPIGTNLHVGDIAVRGWLGGFNAGTTTGATTTGPLPGHVLRRSAAAWSIGSFDLGADDTPGALNTGQAALPATIVLNELRVDQQGNDADQYVELSGPPNASLDGLTYVCIGSEVQTKVPDPQGRVQVAIPLTGKHLDANGFFVIAKTNFSLGTADLTRHFSFRQMANCTHALMQGFTGYEGQDLDIGDDGTLDFAPWSLILDSVGLRRNLSAPGIYHPLVTLGPDDSRTQTYGVGWMLLDRWMPYQASNFVTPPFPGYISGHSTFSRSAAEALTEFTGSAWFPGGIDIETIPAGWLKFERGPAVDLHLEYATYFDMADDAGLSRIYGGIHPRADDLPGRIVGDNVGRRAVARAMALFGGLAHSPDINGDGIVNGGDIGLLLGSWGTNVTPEADLDGNGSVGPEDLGFLLGAWG